jgi:hypothetical protein
MYVLLCNYIRICKYVFIYVYVNTYLYTYFHLDFSLHKRQRAADSLARLKTVATVTITRRACTVEILGCRGIYLGDTEHVKARRWLLTCSCQIPHNVYLYIHIDYYYYYS